MFIFFGWGHTKQKNYGETLPITCPNCHNKVYLNFVHTNVWFTLFFIPVFPYENHHELLCPICSRGIELLKPQLTTKIKELNILTKQYLKGTITEQEYNSKLEQTGLIQPIQQAMLEHH